VREGNENLVQLTPAAGAKVAALVAREGQGEFLRIAISGGGNFSLALRTDGTVAGWGDNSFGQTSVPANITSVIASAAGTYHSLVLTGPLPEALQLMSPVLNGNAVSIPLATSRGKAYFLEYKNSLGDDNWTTLQGVAGNGSVNTLTDPAPSASLRFGTSDSATMRTGNDRVACWKL
jgi:hypothetical protein